MPVFVNVQVVAGAPVDLATTTQAPGGASLSTGKALVALGVGAAVVCVPAWLLRRDWARYALAAALYTRLARSEVLDHPGRDDLRQRIAREPGVCYSDLKASTGMNTGALVHHLRALERAGVVTSRKEGAFRRFYVTGSAPATQAARVLTVATLTPMQARVLEMVREAPLTQGEIAERLGLSQQGTGHHVKALERAGHLSAEFDGRAWRYRPVERFEVLP